MKLLSKLILVTCLSVVSASCGSKREPDAFGIVDARSWMISAQEAGKILSLNISEGCGLIRDSIVGYLDTTLLVLERTALQARITPLRDALPNIGVQVEVLEREKVSLLKEIERSRKLADAGAAGESQVDRLEDKLQVLNSQIAATRSALSEQSSSILSDIEALQSQVNILSDRIERCAITVPEDGTVAVQYAHTHEFVAAGQPIFKLSDYRNMFVDCWVEGKDLADVKLGEEATVLIDGPEGIFRTYSGPVTFIAEEAEFTPNKVQTRDNRTKQVYHVKIELVNDGYLKAGMPADIFLKKE